MNSIFFSFYIFQWFTAENWYQKLTTDVTWHTEERIKEIKMLGNGANRSIYKLYMKLYERKNWSEEWVDERMSNKTERNYLKTIVLPVYTSGW